MNSEKKLEEIIKIREIRNNLVNLDIVDNEKEILRRSLNYYENVLNLDITKKNSNIEEYMEQGIETHEKIVSIPLDDSAFKYQEFTKVEDNNIKIIINNLTNDLITINLDKDSIIVILNSLKEYSVYLEQVNRMRQSNKEIYEEVMDTRSK